MSIINREVFFKIFGSGTFNGQPPLFTGADVEPLIAFSRTFRPKTVIEIGIQRGETAKCILNNSPWIEKYIGIDLAPGSQTSLSVQQHEVPQIVGEYVKDDPRVELIIKPNGSRDIKPSDLPTADLIFIDGDHSLEGVMLDTLLARQVIRKGGIICWHDYGNPPVIDVTIAINSLNISEGDHICLIEHGMLCFQFSRVGR
ncbi:class I SAM-dependent methyltransferase [Bacillus sp. XF8]|uniref:Class I SAM-dependent methyltransferase n=1 Tax=Bacillus bingmayongensis TaxID=1150157 RepID=A0ABU5JS60_9BACI|nr:class I SAM-dependent methyltransferase [Bacillus sp. XF8]MBO1578119.1 class I SAM-dependent methyltransferase [Bacillus sp. XF8]MDZ5606270.1 class I SAM-dependent methyltransferase [Bacillus pseudomycoides]